MCVCVTGSAPERDRSGVCVCARAHACARVFVCASVLVHACACARAQNLEEATQEDNTRREREKRILFSYVRVCVRVRVRV